MHCKKALTISIFFMLFAILLERFVKSEMFIWNGVYDGKVRNILPFI